MSTFNYTEEDVKRGTQVTPGWYLCEISNGAWQPAKDQESENFVVDLKVIQAEGGDSKWAGVPVREYKSEKAPGFWKSFLAAIGFPMNPKGGSLEKEGLGDKIKGKKVYVMIQNDTFDGRPTNKVADYRPATPAK